MKKEALKEKTIQLISDITASMVNNIDKAIESGSMDIENAEDNFILPKKLILALLKEEMEKTKPYHYDKKKLKMFEKEVENIWLTI